MTRLDPPPRPAIRPLDPAAIDRIAAGEVVERPASAVKELVENALDAGATRIDVAIAAGGRVLIRVADDGCGIPRDELALALARHATSKTDGRDLLDIRSFGFRGEALASLAAVARLRLTSRVVGAEGAAIEAVAGRVGEPRPAGLTAGTVVEVRDLFFATPARLKFLRADRAEAQAVADALRRLAMAEPFVGFSLRDLTDGADRLVVRLEAERGEPRAALLARLGAVMGRDFADESVALDEERDGHHLTGHAGLPASARGAAVAQHAFVNGRPVRDKLLAGALRGAYADLVARGRHPSAAIFLDCDPALVDVNVHPAKAEVRFRDPALVRSLVVGGIRRALGAGGARPARALGEALAGAFAPGPGGTPNAEPAPLPGLAEASPAWPRPLAATPAVPEARRDPRPLGEARAHLHGNWILAETATGLVLVDQHAAHERLVYERLKAEAARGPVPAQALLVPEVVALPEAEAARILDAAEGLARLGLGIEGFGPGAVAIRMVPAALAGAGGAALLRDVAAALAEGGAVGDDAAGLGALGARLDAVLARMACHASVRSGRRLREAEMDALLRAMEATPNAGTCNHGRPTFVALALADVERLFGRR